MALTTTREFRSTDAGAPVLTGQVGSGIAWLKACLVNGYGSGGGAKQGAGWTIAFEDAPNNVCVFRNSLAAGGSGCYLRVDDNGTGAGGAREMLVRLYATMSDANTGTEATPPVAAVPSGHVWRKSIDLTGTARAWVLVADERTVTLGVWPGYLTSGTQAGHYAGHAGDYDCDDPAQPWPCVIAGSDTPSNSATSAGCRFGPCQMDNAAFQNGLFVMRDVSRAAVPAAASLQSLNKPSAASAAIGGAQMQMPNPTPAGHTLFHSAVLLVSGVIAGRLRGVYVPQQNVSADAMGTVYPSALGFSPGSRLIAVKHHVAASNALVNLGQLCVEAGESW